MIFRGGVKLEGGIVQAKDRKAAIAAYKERKVIGGIYAVRCRATDRRWIGWAPNLSTIQNRLWFALRLGTSPHRTLQAAWTEHGGESFVLEEVERLDEEEFGVRSRPDGQGAERLLVRRPPSRSDLTGSPRR